MNKPFFALNFLFLVFLSTLSNSQGFLKADGKRIVDGAGKEILLRGMGLGGWMLQEPYMLQLSGIAANQQNIRTKIEEVIGKERTEQFYEAWLANHCRKADIDSLASWGFNSVRLPMHYNLFTLPTDQEPEPGKNTWLSKGFALTDSLLSWCRANKIYLILDLHAAPGGQGNDIPICDRDTSKPSLWQSEANRQKTIALWKSLAERYANEEWVGGYDLLNESNWGFQNATDKNGCAENENAPLRQLLVDLTTAIRDVDRKHIIFLEGNCWGNNYNGIFPLWDKNTVLSFHKYWNYNNRQSIEKFLQIREQHNVPLWMGEAGENSNVWFRDAIELLERNNIGWAWWPIKKLGFNNPLQVNVNNNYLQLVDYWKGKGTRPSPDVALTGFLQLAEDTKTENAIYHKDVIDAMFRQVNSDKTIPFKSYKIKRNTTVFATDYDLGRSGKAYLDKDTGNYWVSTGTRTAGNKGSIYRNDGVDIITCTDSTTNGYSVSSTEAGEWLKYTISSKKRKYNVELRTVSKDSIGKIELMVNDKVVGNTVTSPGAGWTTTVIRDIRLSKGYNKMRLHVLQGGMDLNYYKFVKRTKGQ